MCHTSQSHHTTLKLCLQLAVSASMKAGEPTTTQGRRAYKQQGNLSLISNRACGHASGMFFHFPVLIPKALLHHLLAHDNI
jgi:hypothetical protein